MVLDNIESAISSSLVILAISMWAVIMSTFFAAVHIPQDEIIQTQILSQAVAMDHEGPYIDPASGNLYAIHYGMDNSTNGNDNGIIPVNFTNIITVVPSNITTAGPDYNTSVNTFYLIRTIPIILNSGDLRFQSWTVQAGYSNFTYPQPLTNVTTYNTSSFTGQ